MTIEPEKDALVREWMEAEGWKGAETAVWKQDPEMGFWIWRHHREAGEPTRILAIHEPVIRQHTAAELVANLRLLGVAQVIRRHAKVRVWERGVTGY